MERWNASAAIRAALASLPDQTGKACQITAIVAPQIPREMLEKKTAAEIVGQALSVMHRARGNPIIEKVGDRRPFIYRLTRQPKVYVAGRSREEYDREYQKLRRERQREERRKKAEAEGRPFRGPGSRGAPVDPKTGRAYDVRSPARYGRAPRSFKEGRPAAVVAPPPSEANGGPRKRASGYVRSRLQRIEHTVIAQGLFRGGRPPQQPRPATTVEEFLAQGGQIERLPGPCDPRRRAVIA